ncbi:hypothetical protein KFL_004260130 [Klebsormidium nitens]|uniref:FAS1 domain-containing protein n=1 Tax=Klebsormidium nitens TaxID=105231 RepID=A0A1Y1IBY4_KLENI|nr:hypothetical protein KFL_004260130 [Klebsormidium nitens]|eukprot:GAQ88420.1 hypothetical protein KFL_004260130 [Klebsormidium nitens]
MDEFYFSSAQSAPLNDNQPAWIDANTAAKRGQLARKQARGAFFVLACIFGILFYLGYNDEDAEEHTPYHPLGPQHGTHQFLRPQPVPKPFEPRVLAQRDMPEFAGSMLKELREYGPGPFTLFVPSDLALITLAHTIFGDTGDWRNVPRLLPRLLPFYTVEAQILTRDIPARRAVILRSLNGYPLLFLREGKSGRLTVNGVRVGDSDLLALGAFVHFLDRSNVFSGVESAVRSEAITPGKVVRVNKDAEARRRGEISREVNQTAEDLEEEGIVAEYLFERAEIEAEGLPELDPG